MRSKDGGVANLLLPLPESNEHADDDDKFNYLGLCVDTGCSWV